MKNKIFLSILGLCIMSIIHAQDPREDKMQNRERMREKIEAQRIAYITSKLDLNADESVKFWPVYNEYTKKRMELRKSRRDLRDQEEMNEQDSKKYVEQQIEIQEKDLALKKIYYEKFGNILSSQKLAKLEEAEKEFTQEIIKNLKERRRENRMK
ncbi:MAG: hypothetical protein IPK88_19560 [Saprospiraceae bacterium]|jgi:hypothetical protein|uniref:Sensor of ECF-type sigma factor n=1 Tax=Candidatus Defluviibacterium haderslevense TaxID=2981993 RepID=A0A9D7S9Z2_9BACT|nr:hypothetical protein [Candidatus Defluviibacterium haderslevense]MBK8245635.1 hypothetical protein [Candidatus Defluviibacterium haderslevense]MBK9718094.1 hypothetical protein [Candidatus Defluviibacterium haderslevense]MBL0237075.1 hypothetical protein [Candidatus Defluviibacterium haderslevense]MCI1267762.1 hypothetical protein [Saprospiraceae bacterium]